MPHSLQAVNPPCSPSEIYDGLNSISPMQSADALEDSSLVDLHTDTCSPNEGQLSQDTMHSSGPVEGLPNHHQLALDSRNDNIRQKLKVREFACGKFSVLINLYILTEHVKLNNTCFSICFRGFVNYMWNLRGSFHLRNPIKANQISI